MKCKIASDMQVNSMIVSVILLKTVQGINPLWCFWVPWDALTFVLFSVAYKHINGKGVITLCLAQ